MEECDICCFSQTLSDFYSLSCCKNNKVCNSCIKLLTVALCPFCRQIIPNLDNKRLALSCNSTDRDLEYYSNLYNTTYQNSFDNNLSINHQSYLINPLDDSFTDSRILRRHIRRIRKLEERENNAIYNKNLNKVLNKHSNKKNKGKRYINEIIKYDLEMLQFDIDT